MFFISIILLYSNFSRISRVHISKSKMCFNVKSSTYYFHMKTKILADFQICISVPLIRSKFTLTNSLLKLTSHGRYIKLFVVSGSIKKLFSVDCVKIYHFQSIVFANIYLFSIFFSLDFKSVGLRHTAYIVINWL